MSIAMLVLHIFNPNRILARAKLGFYWAFQNQIAFIRWFYYFKVLRKLNFEIDSNTTSGVSYSREQFSMYKPLSRIYYPFFALMCIPIELSKKILIIGPRYENEVYIARSLGFEKSSISTLDTFSYSPLVTIGDMHQMQFSNQEFSHVLCSWTLSYSANPKVAAEEMIRVTKSGGLIAISVEKISETEMLNGVPGILKGNQRIQTRGQLQELFSGCEIKICIEPINSGMLICVLQRN
jgi:hypothetical protein